MRRWLPPLSPLSLPPPPAGAWLQLAVGLLAQRRAVMCFIASQHKLNQLRLQQYTTPTVYVSSPLTVPRCTNHALCSGGRSTHTQGLLVAWSRITGHAHDMFQRAMLSEERRAEVGCNARYMLLSWCSHRDVSAAVLDDNYFQLLMWSTWPLKSRLPSEAAAGGSRGIVPLARGAPVPRDTAAEAPTPAAAVEVLRWVVPADLGGVLGGGGGVCGGGGD